jgi:TonB family protein
LLLLALACARPVGPTVQAQGAASATPGELEDAFPVFLDEQEVDVPARPAAPIDPHYPPVARAQGLEGDVTLLVQVRADGEVVGLRLLEGDREAFVEAAAQAVRATRFEPGLERGRPVNSRVSVRVRFRLGP